MLRFLAISGAAIIALTLVGGMPALLRRAPPAISALLMPEPGWIGHDPCGDARPDTRSLEGCVTPPEWLEDGWALLSLSDRPDRAGLRADGRRSKPPARL